MSPSPISLSDQGKLQSQIGLLRAWHLSLNKNSKHLWHGFSHPPKSGFVDTTGPGLARLAIGLATKNRLLDRLMASKMLRSKGCTIGRSCFVYGILRHPFGMAALSCGAAGSLALFQYHVSLLVFEGIQMYERTTCHCLPFTHGQLIALTDLFPHLFAQDCS